MIQNTEEETIDYKASKNQIPHSGNCFFFLFVYYLVSSANL